MLAALRRSHRGAGVSALESGDFAAALAVAASSGSREEHLAAARAGKHLLEFSQTKAILDALLASDDTDGEAWIERGLLAAYAGDPGSAEKMLDRALMLRSDLAESITLHRAWVALESGRRADASRLFQEVEVPLETKLRDDMGEGDPLFAEWYLHAAALWAAKGDTERSSWAGRVGTAAAGPKSRLPTRILVDAPDGVGADTMVRS